MGGLSLILIQERRDLIRQMIGVHHDFGKTVPDQASNYAREQRDASDLYQRLRSSLGQWLQPGTQSRRQNHGFHNIRSSSRCCKSMWISFTVPKRAARRSAKKTERC